MNIAKLLGLVLLTTVVTTESAPTAKVTVRVLDDTGKSISDADARVTFEKSVLGSGQWGSAPTATERGRTDSRGLFSASQTSSSHVTFGAVKSDYYPSNGFIDFARVDGGRWIPWNSTVILELRRMVRPIAMYARRVDTKVPIEGSPNGFDLIVSDWVAPHGRGKTADLLFQVNRTIRGPRDFDATLKLTFSNTGDGVYEIPKELCSASSELRLPHSVPEKGYVNEKVSSVSSVGRTKSERESVGFFYRVRTVLDGTGRVETALYGKIDGEIKLHVGTQAPKPGIGFVYYLNPTPNDLNVEFDPQKNLFKTLKVEEQVTAP